MDGLESAAANGFVGDGSADDIQALDATVAAAVAKKRRGVEVPYTANGCRISRTWKIPPGLDVYCHAPRIIYSGNGAEPAVSIGTAAARNDGRHFEFSQTMIDRAVHSDWSDEAVASFELINPRRCSGSLPSAKFFTVGIAIKATGGQGVAWNDFRASRQLFGVRIGYLQLCEANSWQNQNRICGPGLIQSSSVNEDLGVIGWELRGASSSLRMNANRLVSVDFGFGTARTGARTPVKVTKAVQNRAIDCRMEDGDAPYLEVADIGVSLSNIIELHFDRNDHRRSELVSHDGYGGNVVFDYPDLARTLRGHLHVTEAQSSRTVWWNLRWDANIRFTMTSDVDLTVVNGGDFGWSGVWYAFVKQDGAGGHSLRAAEGILGEMEIAVNKEPNAVTVLQFIGDGAGLRKVS